MDPILTCFLDKDRNCQHECMAYCGDDKKPACVFVHTFSVLGLAVAKGIQVSQHKVTRPPVTPPPEVKS